MNKGPTLGSRVRKRLSDITNLNSHSKSPFKDQFNQNDLPLLHDSSTNNYLQRLLKENALMIKLIEEKDKIIESNGVELHKLRGNLQKTQLQNWQLAQSNSQMLADLNLSKDRLKALRHELACKDALYKAKMNDEQVKEKMQGEENIKLEGKTKPEKADVDQPKQANDKNENTVSKTKRGRSTRSQSLGATHSQQDVEKEIAENKRQCLRRQSVTLKPEESDADLYEIDVNAPLSQSVKGPPRSSKSNREEPSPSSISDREELLSQSTKPTLPAPRTSIGRPLRQAAAKIQSYKDKPLNVKMRRPS